jgi:hypothetical protein
VLFPEQVDYFGGAVFLVDALSRFQGRSVFIVKNTAVFAYVTSRAEFFAP